MKIKNILAALLLLVAGLQTAWAQKVVLYKANGQVIEYEVSDLDSIVFVEKEVRLVTKIELSETSITLQPNETKTITAIVLPEDADNKDLVWESSNEGVATVDQTGKVTAVGAGECSITVMATDDSGVKAECTVTVIQLVTAITLDQTTLSLIVGESHTLTATIQPSNATNKNIIWSSNNTNIATVDQTGKVTAVGTGECTITVMATDGSGVKSACTVTIEYEWVNLGLPVSTMLSPDIQWTADMMVFNDPQRYNPSNPEAIGQQVIGMPPTDINGNEWYVLDYQLTNGQASWDVGYSPFLSDSLVMRNELDEEIPWIIWPNSTRWSTGRDVADIYLRRIFTIDHELSDKTYLSCCHDDNSEWYLNGVLIHSVEGYHWDYEHNRIYLTPEQRALIHTDGRKNLLAIHTHNYGGPALADGGLYETEIGLPSSTMVSPEIQWAADMMVFNAPERYGTDADGMVIGTPPSDTRGYKWYSKNYQLTNGQKSWSVGYSPFLSEKPSNDEIEEYRNKWPNSTIWSADIDVADIYLRRTFTVDHELSDKIFLSYCHDDGAEWYLNGVLIHSTEADTWNYDKDEKIYLTPRQRALIHTDGRENVLAIHVHNRGGAALADGGLYEETDSESNPESTLIEFSDAP